ncbi:stalk domain-containing protein [Paenibacillus hodogayensis]|uniref:Stalk domain-containing protein n=1 Tax=Paenibacillus hodogayensis TaxID=279208 RepID=A0ABV5VWS5_9BACL
MTTRNRNRTRGRHLLRLLWPAKDHSAAGHRPHARQPGSGYGLRSRIAALALTALLGVSLALPPVASGAEHPWNLHLKAEAYRQAGQTHLAVPIWDGLMRAGEAAGDWNTAAIYAGYIDEYYDAIGDYENAILYYELENDYWLKDGKDWGANDIVRANQLRTTVELYATAPEDDALLRAHAPSSGSLAKFEPAYGMYVGIYSEQDSEMGNEFNKSASIYGRKHAMYLAYATYGEPFPQRYVQRAKEAGGALQIAWQPLDGLERVADDGYLRQWAKAAKAAGIPIFLRFAGEMNGDWTAWSGDAAAYIEKFRIVADAIHSEAPNVAMVWSPGDVPRYNMDRFYPGDAYVDWVGVSLYTEPYSHGNPQESMEATTPIERLDELYSLYADRKPVMLSESAVSHYTNADDKSHTDFALMNLDRLYRVMPAKYPRLKAITYFNVDLKQKESRNDYLLRDNPDMLALYKTLIADPYMLSEVKTGAKPSDATGYRSASAPFAGKTSIVPFVRIPDIWIGKLEYVLNGKTIAEQTKPPYGISLAAGQVPDGSRLELRVFNRSGTIAATKTVPLSSLVSVRIDGRTESFEQPPVIVDGSTLAPLRAIFERMGAAVTWDAATQTATARKGDKTVTLAIGQSVAYVNGQAVNLGVPARLVGGFTMAPARFVGETFGGTVTWDGDSRTVIIVRKQ